MNTWRLSILAMSWALLNLTRSFADLPADSDCVGITTQVTQGYRKDKLVWSISGPKKLPNILSELTYKDIEIYQTRLNKKLFYHGYFTKLNLGYGVILHGKNNDSDYAQNNRKVEFSRSHSRVTGDYTFDAVLQLGKDFRINSVWTISPFVGYGLYTQKFRVKNGVQDLALTLMGRVIPMHAHFHGLNSTYKATWYGPQIGARVAADVLEKLHVFGEYSFLFPMTYQGTAYWNLRANNYRHFSHSARGFGQGFFIKKIYR